MAQAMVTIISSFAQLERDQPSERTKASMAAAAAHGRRVGRRTISRRVHRSQGMDLVKGRASSSIHLGVV